jgi:hypothetical protein
MEADVEEVTEVGLEGPELGRVDILLEGRIIVSVNSNIY